MRLRHEPDTTKHSPSATAPMVPVEAAEERVTAEELTQALALLEARRSEVIQRTGETVTLGAAIEQLGIHETPEELLSAVREVQNRSAKTAGTRTVRSKKQQRAAFLVNSVLVVMILFMAGFFIVQNKQSPSKTQTVAANQNVQVMDDSVAGAPVMRLLSELPEGRVVHLTGDKLPQLGQWRDMNSNEAFADVSFEAVKRRQHVYISVYVPLPLSTAALRAGGFVVANRPLRPDGKKIGPEPTRYWIPVELLTDMNHAYAVDASGIAASGNAFSMDFGRGWARLTVLPPQPGDPLP